MTSRIFWSEVVSGNATAIQEEVTTRFADYSHRFLAFYSEYQPLCCLFCLISFSLTGKVAVGDCVYACQTRHSTSCHCGFHGSLRGQRVVCGGCVWLHGSHAFAKHNILQSRTTRLATPNTPQYTFISVPHVSPLPRYSHNSTPSSPPPALYNIGRELGGLGLAPLRDVAVVRRSFICLQISR